ncbi:GH25 family lysozyme [Dactylosporangium sp. NPDC000521]|uniref:GH25 family lysozyme n=1 Tax=Dactylosporangium sp. NPDC000521 TaxID=3363975 RepID=UPI0036A977F4
MSISRTRRALSVLLAALTTAATLGLASPAHAAATADPNIDGGGWPGRSSAQHQTTNGLSRALSSAPPAGYPVYGIDVSSHDWSNGKTINWSGEAANGVKFAYIKATEGTSYVNPYYSSDYATAKSVGIYAGAYAFGRPDLGNPVGQADHFVDNMQFTADGKTLPPFLDLEWPYIQGTPACYNLSTSQMVSWISAFLSRVQSRIGKTPMIYTNVNWWNPCTGNSTAFGSYLLDISSCDASPPSVPGWGTSWTFWQYAIPDCDSSVTRDWNVFNGNLTQLAQLAGAAPAQSSGSVVYNGNLYEFARGTDGTVKYWYGNGGPWSATQSLGSAVASDPVATVFNGTLYVFARGTDGTVKYWYANGGAWSAAQTLAGSAGTGPLTSTVFNGSIYLFGRAADGTVKYFFANGGAWSAAQSISTTAVNAPLASTVFNGTLYLFATGTDGTAKYWYANGGAWSATQTVTGSGGLANGLTSTVFNGNLYVFGRGTDGTAKYWYGNGGPWSATQTVTGSGSIGGAVSSSVFNGNLYVFARGTDGTAKYWFGNGGPWSATQTVTNSNGLG